MFEAGRSQGFASIFAGSAGTESGTEGSSTGMREGIGKDAKELVAKAKVNEGHWRRLEGKKNPKRRTQSKQGVL